MPSHSILGRKSPVSRNGLWNERGHSRQLSCNPRAWVRVGYLVLVIAFVGVVVWSHQKLATTLNPSIGCGSVEDTLRSLIVLPTSRKVIQVGAGGVKELCVGGKLENESLIGGTDHEEFFEDLQSQVVRPKVLAFVGIQTGYYSADRRKSLRQTWMPSTPEGIVRLEEETGLVFRFVIGETADVQAAAQLAEEIALYHDFIRIDNVEEYARLPYKTLAYFKAAHMLYDADFYVKADDDIYLRPDRLSLLLKNKRSTSRTYLGCMKKGGVITDPHYKWYEPKGYLLGNEYFYHAYGPIYALSRDVVADLSTFKNDSLRMFSNEDVTIGSWMLAFNVYHEDDRRLCQPTCEPDSIAVWDIPQCSGLCNPSTKLLELHEQYLCSRSPTVAGV